MYKAGYPDIEKMYLSIRERLNWHAEDLIEGVLVNSENAELIRKSTSELKSMPYSRCGFECRLDKFADACDFGLSITKETAEDAIRNGSRINDWLGGEDTPERYEIEGFLRQWMDKKSLFYYCINTIYLELDIGSSKRYLSPGIFIRLFSGNHSSKWYEMISLAVLNSFCIELNEQKRSFITNYFNKLSEFSELFQLGIMFSRDDCPLKLVAMNVSGENTRKVLEGFEFNILDYISEADWKSILEFSSGYMNLSLDYTGKIGKRIGIEIERLSNTEKFLNWLVEKGCCSENKRQVVLNWAGETVLRSDCQNDCENITVIREISHFKLVLLPGESIRSKVYLVYYRK